LWGNVLFKVANKKEKSAAVKNTFMKGVKKSKKIEWPRKKNGLIIAEQIKRTRASGAASPFLLLLLALESFYHNADVLVRVPVFCVCV